MSGTAVIAWNQAALAAVRHTRLGPPMVARAVHVLHSAMYDAWAADDPLAVGTRLGDLLHCPQAEPSEQAKREAVRGPRLVTLPSVVVPMPLGGWCSSTRRGTRAAPAAPLPALGRVP